MVRKWLKLSQSGGIILDVCDQFVLGHLEVQLPDVPLPLDIKSGEYRWEVDTYKKDPSLKLPPTPEEKEEQLKARIDLAENAIMNLLDMSLI
ncbi:hypothetical protein JCM17380_03530 [Desulfosporosinus burensis]